MERRLFLKLAGTASLAFAAPRAAFSNLTRGARWDRILVLVELNGGNDGLNTVVPFADPAYRKLRPRLGVNADSVLRLSERVGFNSKLQPLMSAWHGRELAVVLGLGYERPNRSHFRSIEIWDTGSDSNEYLEQGWLARLFTANAPPESLPANGIIVGKRSVAGPLTGSPSYLTMRTPDRFVKQARDVPVAPRARGNDALAHLLSVQDELHEATRVIEKKIDGAPELPVDFPKSRLGSDLAAATSMLQAGIHVPVIKVSQSGYDTHSNQRGTHERLLGELATSLAAFRSAMMKLGLWDRVLVMTYSEFGRRARENGSNGTDHGTAAPHLILGGRVKGGLHGSQPSLTDLDSKDLKHAVDYRRLYATVARRWWEVPTRGLQGLGHAPLEVLKT